MKHSVGLRGGALPIMACLLVAAASLSFDDPVGQASTAPGTAFAGACAGNETFGGVGDPGSIYNNGVGINFGDGLSYFSCNSGNSGVGGSVTKGASNSGNFFGNPWSNQSTSTAAPEQIHLQGSNVATTLSEFSGATANGGWNDDFTLQITDPSVHLTTPVSGFWVVPINVDGSLSVTGAASLAQFSVAAYENNNEVLFDSGGGAAWNFFTANNTLANGEVGASWDYEQVVYGAGASVPSLNVNSTILFALPVTFSSNTDTIEAGFYAQLWITQSSGAPAIPSTETASFQNTVGWGGPGELVLGGTTYQSDDFSVTGDAGVNYEAAFGVPEPSAVTVLALAMGAVLLFFRRRQARKTL